MYCLQVTNPPIDPLREGLVMSLEMRLGGRGNLLQTGEGEQGSARSSRRESSSAVNLLPLPCDLLFPVSSVPRSSNLL